MSTITLKQAASHEATAIHTMTAQPMNIQLMDLTGGAIQFRCSNKLNTIKGATSVDIVYDAAHGSEHQTRSVSSVQS